MSTREIAFDIINNMTDEQVDGFVAMFGIRPQSKYEEEGDGSKDPLDDLLSLIKPCPDIGDYKEERHKYLEEKYGT